MQFPGEDQRIPEIQQGLAKHFEFCQRILSFWVHREKDQWLDASRLPGHVLDITSLLNVQACRQLRAVIEESKRGEGAFASVVVRGLYETVLAQYFVLKKRLRIVVSPMRKKPGKYCAKIAPKRHVGTSRDWTPRHVRAFLFATHLLYQDEANAVKMGKIAALKGQAKRIKRLINPQTLARFEREIGKEWTSVLKESGSYSGLSIADLARVLDRKLFHWYLAIYSHQSRMVHSTDVLRFAKPVEDHFVPQWLSTNDELCGVLHAGCALFLMNMSILQNNIGYGAATRAVIDAFIEEFHGLFED